MNSGGMSKNLGVWINKCGGKRKFAVDEAVHVAIIEMAKINSIIHSFVAWRASHSNEASVIDTEPSTR